MEQRSLLIAAPILEHGRPEMEKSCREWTSRLLASPGFLGQARPGRMVFVSPGRPRSCPRGSSCKASFPRFPATEAADKSAPRAATTLEFECERICRQHGVNTGPSHRRKWPYNLSPSGRGAINRAALSANELLLSPYPLPRARELKIDEEDWRCFRLIDREVYLGWPLAIAISHGRDRVVGRLDLFSFFFLFFNFWIGKRRACKEENGRKYIFENRSWNCVNFK